MILYNVTIALEPEIEKQWVSWMQDIHIPHVIDTGLFTGHRFFKLVMPVEDGSGPTYCVQYYLADMDDYSTYEQQHAPRLRAETQHLYGDKVLAFRTLLQTVDSL